MQYEFKWKQELTWALATFIIFMLGQFIATGEAEPTDWGDWLWGASTAGLRAVAAALLPRLTAVFTSR